MRLRHLAACAGLPLVLFAAGCGRVARIDLVERTGGSAALVGQFRAYDGHDGHALSFREAAERCRRADVILFGEEHNDVVCNEIEAQLLYALQTQARPAALAMEFFETDTQAALDAYLLGRVGELPFRKETRQGRAYVLSHRPLIELCRLADIPVVAANAPRRLVRAYRTSGLDFEEFRAGLDPADQRWLPTSSEYLSGEYEERFLDTMREHALPAATQPTSAPASQPTSEPATMPTTEPATQPAMMPPSPSPAALYRSQLLWDQTIAESLANFRARFPSHRVMLVVGTFHVAHTGGTAIKFRERRPDDRVVTIAYRGSTDGEFPFDAEDRDAGDIVIYGITPPPEEERPSGMPTGMPAPAPTTAPAAEEAPPATQPAGAAPASTQPVFVPREIPIRDALVIGKIGKWGRSAVHTDAVEAQLVAGHWKPPVAGETLASPDGSAQTWTTVSATEDGAIRDEALQGGYAYAAVESDHEQVLLLEASGHSMVYVNGEPRVGDPYQWGFVRLPVRLHAGTNDFLFACGRGEFRAKLIEPRAPILLDTPDATLPDLIFGEDAPVWGAVVVLNATAEPLRGAELVARCGGESRTTPLPPIPPLTVRKVGFQIPATAPQHATADVELELRQGGARVDAAVCPMRVRQPHETHKRTFASEIDGSVQYYAVQPMQPGGTAMSDASPALFLSLHGASVEALGQAECYTNKTWGYVVAPTNRRPYGFDWEDWGRLDALEVLADAERRFGTDPLRTYLTGHSMGGHGTWQIGATYPDRFAAIAPSAGWISFFSYAGGERFEGTTPIEALLQRATNPSDTLGLSRNYLHYGVYILHGDQDDNVPVTEARAMREHLGQYHPNFAYYERPGAGHWWGNECMDWPPLFDFLRQNTRPAPHTVRHVEFITANPAISATCDWVTIETQVRCLDFSLVDLKIEPRDRCLHGTTENVARLTIRLAPEKGVRNVFDDEVDAEFQPFQLELDGDKLENVPWPPGGVLHLIRQGEHWQVASGPPSTRLKGPHRGGPFKEAFRHRVQLVYGTHGTPEENAWACSKARYDAEVFRVRGNGAFDVLADSEFDPAAEPDRNVVLYGNADTNGAARALLRDCPIQVSSGHVQMGEQDIASSELAVLAVYPRPDSAQALVGIVGGTGLTGMRLTERLPYFVSGVAYPDWIVLGPELLQSGVAGVRDAGFFGNDWQIDPEQAAGAR